MGNTLEAVLRPQYIQPAGLGQYNSLGAYCGPHTASSVSYVIIFYCEFEISDASIKIQLNAGNQY